MDKTQLPKNFGLFHTSFAEDYIGSNKGLKNVLYATLKWTMESIAPRFWTFPYFFTEDYKGISEGVKVSYMAPKNGQNSTAPRFWTFPYFFLPKTI